VKVLLFLAACVRLMAQDAGPAPSFEVASFRRQASNSPQPLAREVSPIGVTLRNATLGNCIEWAYGYPHSLIIGPDWRDRPTDVAYDIMGKVENPVPEPQLKLMLQALLQERLGLTVHREKRQLPVYALVVDRNGPKFRKSPSTGDMATHYLGGLGWRYERISMKEFVKTMYPPFTSRYVVDETGLAGVYDFTLDLNPYLTDPATGQPILNGRTASGQLYIDGEPGFLQALPKQLGLRLEPKTAPIEMLVIDKVAKDPTAN
jgi:uncharacterized protein (TIGR03435 family)